MQAVLLAGGRGTRLGSLTDQIPKPLIPVRGRPFLEWILLKLRSEGIRKIVLCTGYRSKQVADYFGEGARWGLSIRYSVEDQPLGTGGAIRKAQALLEDRFLVVNADTYNEISYAKLWRDFEKNRVGGMVLASADPEGYFLKNLSVDTESWLVQAYGYESRPEKNYVDCGVKILTREIFSQMNSPDPFPLEPEVLNRLAREGILMAYPTEQMIFDIGTPKQLKRAEATFPIHSFEP